MWHPQDNAETIISLAKWLVYTLKYKLHCCMRTADSHGGCFALIEAHQCSVLIVKVYTYIHKHVTSSYFHTDCFPR